MVDFYYFFKSVKGTTFHFRTTVKIWKNILLFLRLKTPHFSTTCTNNCGKTFRKSFEFVKVFSITILTQFMGLYFLKRIIIIIQQQEYDMK